VFNSNNKLITMKHGPFKHPPIKNKKKELYMCPS